MLKVVETKLFADHQERIRPTHINYSQIFNRTSRFWWKASRIKTAL